jgi:hypothetical protein
VRCCVGCWSTAPRRRRRRLSCASSQSLVVAAAVVPEGAFVGVMVHVREGLLSELEAHSLSEIETFTFPRPEDLRPMGEADG